MANYATVEQLESRWRPLSVVEKARALVLLGDASAQLRVECRGLDEKIVAVLPATSPELDPVIPERVVCDMVKRAMLNSEQASGISSTQATAGPFSQSFNYTNPTGDMYLTKAERRLLGCGKGRPFMIDTMPPGAGVSSWKA